MSKELALVQSERRIFEEKSIKAHPFILSPKDAIEIAKVK